MSHNGTSEQSKKHTINPPVFIISAVLIIALVLSVGMMPQQAEQGF